MGREAALAPSLDLQIRLLGPLEIVGDGDVLAVAGPKRRALLARLAVSVGQVVEDGRLVEDLRSERSGAGSLATLQSHVSNLRRDLGAFSAIIETRPPGYRLAVDPALVDAWSFEQELRSSRRLDDPLRTSDALVRALGRWRGPALAEFDAPWARDHRTRLEELRLRAIEVRIEADLQLGRHADLVGELEALSALHPLREPLWLHLMSALRGSGRHAEALRVGQRLRAVLREVGIDPSPALAEMEALVLSHHSAPTDPRPAPPPAGVQARRRDAAIDARERRRLPFVGRSKERSVIADLIALAGGGVPTWAVLSGEPGVGKSRLAKEAANDVRAAGGRVLVGRCDRDLQVPLRPFAEALADVVEQEAQSDLPKVLGRWPAELGRLLPELAGAGGPPSPEVVEPEVERHRLFTAVTDWLRVMSSSRLTLLVLEDLQWADRSTLLLFRHVTKSLASGSLLLLVTYRDTEIGGRPLLTDVLYDLAREPAAAHLEVGGLGEADVVDLLRRWPVTRDRFDTPDGRAWARRTWQLTGGNPLFTEEMLNHLAECGDLAAVSGPTHAGAPATVPNGILGVVAQRLIRLSPETVRTLEAAAVLGTDFDVDVLWRMGRRDLEAVAGAIDEAIEAGFVTPVPGAGLRHRFRHALLRDAVYSRISEARRTVLHREAGLALETLGPAEQARHALALAQHFSIAAALEPTRAVRHSHAAGRDALARRAPEESAALNEQALALLDRCPEVDPHVRCEILLDLGEAQRRMDGDAHRATFLTAADLAGAMGDVDRLGRAGKGISRPFVGIAGEPDPERLALLRRAIEAYGDDPTASRAKLLAGLAGETRRAGHRARSLELGTEAVEVARRSGDPHALVAALLMHWDLLFHPGTLDERRRLSAELIHAAETTGDPGAMWRARLRAFNCDVERGCGPATGHGLDDLERLGSQVTDPTYASIMPTVRATWALARGNLDEAEDRAHEVLSASDADRTGQELACAVLLFQVRWLQDRLPELADQWPSGPEALPAARAGHALIRVRGGDRAGARAVLDSLFADGRAALPADATWAFGAAALAEVLADLGDASKAAALEETLLPCSTQFLAHATYFLGPVARVLGLLRLAQGDRTGAVRRFRSAESLLEGFGAPAHLALIRRARSDLPAVG
jgi:DNA-binding SARP family transcriptional activator